MKITNKIKNAIVAFNGTDKQENSFRDESTNFLRFGARNRMLAQNWSQVEMTDEDMYTGYGYAVIERRANRASALGKGFLYTTASPAVAEAAKEKGEDIVHPYLKLINKSKRFTKRKFWHDISTYLDLEGIYYLMAVRAVTVNSKGEVVVGEVQDFVMLNPYDIRRVRRESDGTIGGYIEQTPDGLVREIPPEMIIEIRLLNPFNNEEPYSMADAAKESQFTLKQAGDYTRNSINGNINTPGILSTDVMLEDHLFDNFVSHIKNHGKGEPLYGNGTGAISWNAMQIDLDKAGLSDINEIHRSTLFAVSGVSKTAVGIEESGVTRDSSNTQKDSFTENSVMPRVEDVIDALNLDYKRWYIEWDENEYEICLDNPLESDREAELKDIEIRDSELSLRDSLVAKGYEYDIAAKYAHGEISIEDLGEPTLEPEITPQQADAIAAQEAGINMDAGTTDSQTVDQENVDAQEQAPNSILVKNKFVTPETNQKTLEEARKKIKSLLKEEKSKKKTAKDKTVNQLSANDVPNLYDDIEIDTRAVSDDNYRGCIMMNTEVIPVLQFVKDAEQDLVTSTNRHDHTMGAVSEIEPHTTLLYGLLNNGNAWKDKVDQVLEGWSMDTVKIEEVSYFETPDSIAIVGLLEKTDELIDGHERLTLLPHVNTHSEYKPHITLAYISKEADTEKWINSLGRKYNGQIVATKGINYGDDEEEDGGSEDNNLKDKVFHTNHENCGDINIALDKANNELDPAIKDQVVLQESNLRNAITNLDRDIQNAVLRAIQEGNIDEAERLISAQQEEGFVAELAAIIAAYYTVMFPIYAAQVFASRLAEFGQQGVFNMSNDIEEYINRVARQAAESHVSTILSDYGKSTSEVYESVANEEFIRLIQDKVNSRDPELLSKLPDNPNPEDVRSAVRLGKIKDETIYKEARRLAREGAGLAEVTRKLQSTFEDVAKKRAQTIARHEANRVFNISQYQADLQFLNESGNMKRAYKRLISRTGDPCPVCSLIIDATRVKPIPFKQNFASLGDVLTARYKKPNGKVGIQKVPINWESIKAGNIHVNCNCEYELIIK